MLWELTAGTLGAAPAIVNDAVGEGEGAAALPVEEEEQPEEDMEDMRNRLEALRS